MELAPDVSEPSGAHSSGQRASVFTLHEWMLLLTLAAIQFTHIVDFMIIMPLGEIFIREMHIDQERFGHIVGAYTISAGVASLIASRFLDHFGRKRALLFLYAGFCLGTLACGLANGYWALMAARVITGAFGGVAASVVLAVVGDSFRDERRATAMGVVMTAFSVASVAGVPIGIELADALDWHKTFFALASAGAVVWTVSAIFLPTLRGHLNGGPIHAVSLKSQVLNSNHLRAFALMATLVLGSFTVFTFLANYLKQNVRLNAHELAGMYILGGAATIFTTNVVGRLADRHGKLRLFRLMAAATVLAMLAVTNLPPNFPYPLVLGATTFCFIVTSGRMVPAMAMITASAAPRERGAFMSLNSTVQHLMSGLGSMIGGLILGNSDGDEPLVGFWRVGLVAAAFTLATLWFAGHLRPAPGGEAAPDADEVG